MVQWGRKGVVGKTEVLKLRRGLRDGGEIESGRWGTIGEIPDSVKGDGLNILLSCTKLLIAALWPTAATGEASHQGSLSTFTHVL